MDPDVRTAVLTVGIIFWALFALLTINVVLDEGGLDVTSVAAILILALLAPPLFGSLKGPPR